MAEAASSAEAAEPQPETALVRIAAEAGGTKAAPFWSVGTYAAAFANSSASLGEINDAVFTFVRGESAAAVVHMKALTQVRSAGDLVRLQFGEFRRAADASMSCLGSIVRSASRFGITPRP